MTYICWFVTCFSLSTKLVDVSIFIGIWTLFTMIPGLSVFLLHLIVS